MLRWSQQCEKRNGIVFLAGEKFAARTVSSGRVITSPVFRGKVMFKNETERAFVLVLLLCGFIALWIVVKDLALPA